MMSSRSASRIQPSERLRGRWCAMQRVGVVDEVYQVRKRRTHCADRNGPRKNCVISAMKGGAP